MLATDLKRWHKLGAALQIFPFSLPHLSFARSCVQKAEALHCAGSQGTFSDVEIHTDEPVIFDVRVEVCFTWFE